MVSHEQFVNSSSLTGQNKECQNPVRDLSISLAKCTKLKNSLARMGQLLCTAGRINHSYFQCLGIILITNKSETIVVFERCIQTYQLEVYLRFLCTCTRIIVDAYCHSPTLKLQQLERLDRCKSKQKVIFIFKK